MFKYCLVYEKIWMVLNNNILISISYVFINIVVYRFLADIDRNALNAVTWHQ